MMRESTIHGRLVKMRLILGSLSIFLVASNTAPAYGQQFLAVPAFLDLVKRGTDLANNCSATANRIVAVPVPNDLTIALANTAANAKALSSKPLPVSEQSRAYLQQMETLKLLLSYCGKNFAAAQPQIKANAIHYYALIDKDAMPRPDAQKVFAAMAPYDTARGGLVKAILALSNDRQVQSLVHKVIVDDFIEEAKK